MPVIEEGVAVFAGDEYIDVTYKRAFKDDVKHTVELTQHGNVNAWTSNLTGVGFRLNVGGPYTGNVEWKLVM